MMREDESNKYLTDARNTIARLKEEKTILAWSLGIAIFFLIGALFL